MLITANEAPGRYYVAARVYASAQGAPFDNTTTTAILEYKSAPCPAKGVAASKPILPILPAFATGIKSPLRVKLPMDVDENLFFTVGLGTIDCPKGKKCQGPNGKHFTASMNNTSFMLPSNFSILQAHHLGLRGVFTTDFPPVPPVQFDYTARNVSQSLWQPVQGTKVYKLKYRSTVQIVLQGTNIFTGENHPIHLHGYDFYILAEGFGNFNPSSDTAKFNLVDPPLWNTAAVPKKLYEAMSTTVSTFSDMAP